MNALCERVQRIGLTIGGSVEWHGRKASVSATKAITAIATCIDGHLVKVHQWVCASSTDAKATLYRFGVLQMSQCIFKAKRVITKSCFSVIFLQLTGRENSELVKVTSIADN